MRRIINFLDVVSTHFLICEEMFTDNGEDSGLKIFNEYAGLIGVFDGCGGLGAMRYPKIKNKTGAYLASRVVNGAVKDWFEENCAAHTEWDCDKLKYKIAERLNVCRSNCGDVSFRMKGTMISLFPTTMAVIVAYMKENRLFSKHIWAGDSRTYILSQDGLAQVSKDDIEGEDAFSNLSNDGILTNVVAADKKYRLHSTELAIDKPCILLTATDGCFGYVSSPMMFEYMLLSSLDRAENVYEWQNNLKRQLKEYSEDDYTLSMTALKYESFYDLKHAFAIRYKYIEEIVNKFESVQSERKEMLWKDYSKQYYRLQK